MNISLPLLLSSVGVLLINIPFGYWRSNVEKYSLQWVLAIHIPVPFIIIFRIMSQIGFHWSTYVFFVAAFFLGQMSGSKLQDWINNYSKCPHSSCLIMDVYRCLNHR